MKLIPKNWEKFQHYKHRSPPWIKLHRDILDDYDWWALPIASRAIAPCLWLLASCEEDGIFDASPEKLAFRFRMTEKDIQLAVKPLIDNGYFVYADEMLAPCYQDAMSEKSKSKSRDREEKKRELVVLGSDDFDLFWQAYPKKKSKEAAKKTWLKLKPNLDEVLTALRWQVNSDGWKKQNGQFIPYPERYLIAGNWQDEQPIEELW